MASVSARLPQNGKIMSPSSPGLMNQGEEEPLDSLAVLTSRTCCKGQEMIDPSRMVRDWHETRAFTKACTICGERIERVRPRGGIHSSGLCKACYRVYWHKWKYDLTGDQVVAMMEAQGRKCAICQDALDIRRFHVDHDHATGNVRGLLCRHCNSGLGMFRDDIHSLENAVSYLRKHNNSEA